MKNNIDQRVQTILQAVLGLPDAFFDEQNPALLDAVAQLDSASVLQILVMIEDDFGIQIHDDEVSAEHFLDFEALSGFVGNQVRLSEAS